ncbi:SLC13 family permease [Auritidibacter ignavus]|uniref:SLC13 family permease n=1 Tax=Auritidibacter ignavus TaxID=678932 RepID=UPI00244984A1|nr:DASS family sodium-coupled anion symporter [Auritidibacter ignavus]WGH83881.1 DASS family sodium-coupled anion symporter [Auritidibacter ignavus]WGH86228.1 DASS family sodium-coupled anion symporter [Auritidibacter ignavus]WGH88512.1 DASS family sodium-coupled anion symporter [Auritidibacter ignavus]
MSSEKSTRHYASSHYTKTQHASSQYPSTQYRSTQTELSEGMKAPADGDLMRRLIGLGLGIVLALLVYFLLPADTGVWPRLTGATAVLMAVWWMTEAIPIPATALLPLVIFPVFVPAEETPEGEGVSFDTVGANYGNNVIFLFLGGFLLALAMQRWNLHRRIALLVLRSMGSNSSALVGGFMISTGFLSMWVSNTATAVMMLPIGVSVLVLVNQVTQEGDAEASVESMVKTKFGTALMLGIAYAASIGSVSTIIGTPPNALLAAHMSSNEDMTIGFGQWMLVGVPLAVVLMLATWFILVKVLFKPEIKHIPGGREMLQKESEKLGPVSSGERRVLIIFILAAVSWVFIPLLSEYVFGLEDAFISDAGIAIAVGLLLFLLPAGPDAESGVRLLDWESAVELPWGVLLLFGGGLALSGQFSDSGLSEWLGEQATSLSGMSLWILVALAAVAILLLTEMTSNTATAATFLPVASGVAMGTGVEPLMLCAPVALAATCAFMLPVATPPNAIAYGSGYVTIGQMVRGGVLVNIVAAILITLVSMTLLVWVFL